jgi:hypothetical protein
MSNSNDNEIDDILNEIKQRNSEENNGTVDAKENEVNEDLKTEEAENSTDEVSDIAQENDEPEQQPQEDNKAENFEIVDDSTSNDDNNNVDIMASAEPEIEEQKTTSKKKIAIVTIIVLLIVAIAVGVFAYIKSNEKEPETTTVTTTTVTTTVAPVLVKNPLTNEDNFNESALNQRPVAIVVENASDARPQWGMDDDTSAPDIILEGEVEGGETRMLWFYADYNSLDLNLSSSVNFLTAYSFTGVRVQAKVIT